MLAGCLPYLAIVRITGNIFVQLIWWICQICHNMSRKSQFCATRSSGFSSVRGSLVAKTSFLRKGYESSVPLMVILSVGCPSQVQDAHRARSKESNPLILSPWLWSTIVSIVQNFAGRYKASAIGYTLFQLRALVNRVNFTNTD